MTYQHKQIGSVIIAGIWIVLAAFILWFPDRSGMIRGVVCASLLLSLAMFYSLTVEVSGSTLVCRFGIGLIQRSLSLADIENARVVRNPWYSGWGIRWRPGRYLLWSVSGYQAVELELRDGNRFRIGTDEPENLLNALRSYSSLRW